MDTVPLPERTHRARRGCIGKVASLFLTRGRETTAREAHVLDLTWFGVRGDRHAAALRSSDTRTPWHPKGCRMRIPGTSRSFLWKNVPSSRYCWIYPPSPLTC